MAQAQHTLTLASLEEAITVLFCLVDDTYALLNPKCQSHESLKKLSDSEVLTPWRSSNNLGGWRARGLSCATSNDSLFIYSRAWQVCTPARSIDAFADSGAIWSPCGVRW
jgi:hypothetical protein